MGGGGGGGGGRGSSTNLRSTNPRLVFSQSWKWTKAENGFEKKGRILLVSCSNDFKDL